MRPISEEMFQKAVKAGYTPTEARQGWTIFKRDKIIYKGKEYLIPEEGNGYIQEIEKIDAMNVFDSDEEAAALAEKNNYYKIIHVDGLKPVYPDTPANREIIDAFLKEITPIT